MIEATTSNGLRRRDCHHPRQDPYRAFERQEPGRHEERQPADRAERLIGSCPIGGDTEVLGTVKKWGRERYRGTLDAGRP
jgi:hypothetical protein